jgi:hypothetical protein
MAPSELVLDTAYPPRSDKSAMRSAGHNLAGSGLTPASDYSQHHRVA